MRYSRNCDSWRAFSTWDWARTYNTVTTSALNPSTLTLTLTRHKSIMISVSSPKSAVSGFSGAGAWARSGGFGAAVGGGVGSTGAAVGVGSGAWLGSAAPISRSVGTWVSVTLPEVVSGNLSRMGNVSVKGKASVTGKVSVKGKASVNGNLSATGAVSVMGTVSVLWRDPTTGSPAADPTVSVGVSVGTSSGDWNAEVFAATAGDAGVGKGDVNALAFSVVGEAPGAG